MVDLSAHHFLISHLDEHNVKHSDLASAKILLQVYTVYKTSGLGIHRLQKSGLDIHLLHKFCQGVHVLQKYLSMCIVTIFFFVSKILV